MPSLLRRHESDPFKGEVMIKNMSNLLGVGLSSSLILLSACNGTGTGSQAILDSGDPHQIVKPGNQAPPATVASRSWSTDALLFVGSGTWGAEVASLENILASHGATYQTVSSAELDTMSLEDLVKFGLLIFPGGEGGTQAASLSADTHARLREAVQVRGVSYVGFCAGAFIAVGPAPAPGKDVSYGLGIVPGAELPYYYLENQLNPDIAMTMETFADGSQRDLVWYGGPVTPNIQGGVIAKYPNGDPAMTEVWSGQGFVILSAVHPTAPQSVRDAFGLNDSDGLDLDLAWRLLEAALHQKPLLAF